jgi:hypothetical protein
LNRHPVALDTFLEKAMESEESDVGDINLVLGNDKLTLIVYCDMRCSTLIASSIHHGPPRSSSRLHHEVGFRHGG